MIISVNLEKVKTYFIPGRIKFQRYVFQHPKITDSINGIVTLLVSIGILTQKISVLEAKILQSFYGLRRFLKR